MKVLFATDGSPCSDKALDEIVNRPWPDETEFLVVSAAQLGLVYLVEPWLVTPRYHSDLRQTLTDQAVAAIDDAVSRVRDAGLSASGELLTGSPKRAIVAAAERWGADLVVVGSHGYGALDRFLLGSVSSAVAAHAPCSVEVVREHA